MLRRGGEVVTISRPGDGGSVSVTVRCKPTFDGANQPSPGTSKRKGTLILSPTGLGALGTIKKGDKLKLLAGNFTVDVPGPRHIGDTPVRYDVEFV